MTQKSNAISGVGVKFRRWNSESSPAEYEALSEINNISGPGMSRETIDVTSLDSEDGYREFIAAIRDGGTITFSMNFTNAGYKQMKDDFEDDDLQEYQIAIPDADDTALEFSGLVTELPLNIEVADKITCDITIKISGKVDLTEHDLGSSN